MVKKEQLYEGKAKKVFATDDPSYVIVSYKDDATAFDGTKRGTIMGKGAVNNRMSNFLMKKLEAAGIPYKVKDQSIGPKDRRTGSLGGSSRFNTLFQIYVKKEDLDRARHALR